MNSLEQAVINTVAYSRVFGVQPSVVEVWAYCFSQKRVSLQMVKKICEKFGFCTVNNFSLTPEWKKEIEILLFWLRFIPGLRSVWITGSVASFHPKPDDDLDIMVITRSHSLWLSRFFLVCLALLLGKYRSHTAFGSQAAKKWCLNLWLEDRSQGMSSESHNRYVSREIMQALPIYEASAGACTDFLDKNQWVERWSANGYILAKKRAQRVPVSGLSLPLLSPVYVALNFLAYVLQMASIRQRQTTERVSRHAAFFHPRPTAKTVLGAYEKIRQDMLASYEEPIKNA